MKKGLIDPNTKVLYISAWNPPVKQGEPYTPVVTEVPDSDRLAEVIDNEFEVAPPLFWADCPDQAIADQWYYDNVKKQVLIKPEDAPYPS